MKQRTLVLGAGFVGSAAAWDLSRRGHDVVITDRDPAAVQPVGEELGLEWTQLDVADRAELDQALSAVDSVVSAVPYSFGVDVAAAAVRNRCHYFDFGGNPTIVKRQLELNEQALSADVAVVPDCGLAPGLANVMAAGLIAAIDADNVDEDQIRVGVLPQHPEGTLQYQLVFYAGGLINEYAEPCEVIAGGKVSTVPPLTRFEQLHWEGLGTLEAFSTAGGTSTMCDEYAGRVDRLEYKTIRYPGHGRIFAAMRELGFFATEEQVFGDVSIAPRRVLLDLLTEHLPQTGPDRSLVSVVVAAGGKVIEQRIDDVADERFSSLSRTTAFPATSLCDLIGRGEVGFRGAAAMHTVAPVDKLLPDLEPVGIRVQNR